MAVLLAGSIVAACSRAPRNETGGGAQPATLTRGGEMTASQRTEPGNYNRYFEQSAAAELLAQLTHAKLVRVNRATDELEPALAERWETADGVTYDVTLRPNVRFSDGVPFSSADVVFSLTAAYDAPESMLASAIRVAGKPLAVVATGPGAVKITFPQRFAPGMRILDNIPILPRHKLQSAFDRRSMREAWTPKHPVSEIAGLGPFVLAEHLSGQRMVLTRNPHYWRQDKNGVQLPYLDRVTLVLVGDQSAEALRLEAGAIDVMANADIQPENYSRLKQKSAAGRLQLIDGGVGLDPSVLWFNLAKRRDDRKPWMRRKEFRQAVSYAVDRQAIADTAYLGAATPLYGPITPRNAVWFSPSAPTYPHDLAKARELLSSIGLVDRNGDGMLEDGDGRPARFSILLREGSALRARVAAILQDQLKKTGIAVDVVGLDMGSVMKRWSTSDYDSIFHGFDTSATDPAMTLDFWLSSGSTHFWNPAQPVPSTPWERRIDELMLQQASSASLQERQRLFAEVQRIFGEELPALYFVAPKLMMAASSHVRNLQAAPQNPHFLWSADSIAVVPR